MTTSTPLADQVHQVGFFLRTLSWEPYCNGKSILPDLIVSDADALCGSRGEKVKTKKY
jgi:hypothetical protein